MRPFAETAVSPGVSAPLDLPRPVPSGCYYGSYYWEVESGANVDQVNLYSYTWDYSNLDTSQGVYISNAISSSYFSIDISVIPSDDWKASSSAENRSIIVTLLFLLAMESIKSGFLFLLLILVVLHLLISLHILFVIMTVLLININSLWLVLHIIKSGPVFFQMLLLLLFRKIL